MVRLEVFQKRIQKIEEVLILLQQYQNMPLNVFVVHPKQHIKQFFARYL
ncbi:MAG: hypothetical protein Fur0016_22230 [Anaerolineales bacterium]